MFCFPDLFVCNYIKLAKSILSPALKVPLKSNFPSFMFERFLKVHAVFTYLPKFGFDTSKGSVIFRTGKVAIFTAAITGQSSSKPEEDAVTI